MLDHGIPSLDIMKSQDVIQDEEDVRDEANLVSSSTNLTL